MKYFSQKAFDRGFKKNFSAYQKQLAKLQGRVSRQAWNFFAFGFRGWGLHDARLLAFSVGDGLDHLADARQQFDKNEQRRKCRF